MGGQLTESEFSVLADRIGFSSTPDGTLIRPSAFESSSYTDELASLQIAVTMHDPKARLFVGLVRGQKVPGAHIDVHVDGVHAGSFGEHRRDDRCGPLRPTEGLVLRIELRLRRDEPERAPAHKRGNSHDELAQSEPPICALADGDLRNALKGKRVRVGREEAPRQSRAQIALSGLRAIIPPDGAELGTDQLDEAACLACDVLSEPKREQMRCSLATVGIRLVVRLCDETMQIEREGGMITADGSRARTRGGVFFKLLSQAVTPPQKKAIFGAEEARKRAAKRQRARGTSRSSAAPANI